MATKQSTDLKELKTLISDRFDRLDGKVEKLTEKVDSIDKRLIAVETKIDSTEKRLGTVESKLPDISEKFGELKNWRQIAFIIIAAVIGWFARSTKF
jgi:chromosome segregation ATPase